jgi:hypothetical protein
MWSPFTEHILILYESLDIIKLPPHLGNITQNPLLSKASFY